MGGLFGFGSSPWVLHVACAAIYLTMAVIVVTRGPRATLNRTCAVLIACFAFWCGCLAVSHFPGVSRATAVRFYDVGSFAWGCFSSLAVLFIACFVRPSLLRSKAFLAALALPSAAAIYAQWTGLLAADYVERSWGWAFVWSRSAAANLFITYYSLYMVAGLALLAVGFAPAGYARQIRSSSARNRAAGSAVRGPSR